MLPGSELGLPPFCRVDHRQMSLSVPCRLVTNGPSYFSRLPDELWTEIVAYLLQKTRLVQSNAPYPLAGTESVTWDDRTTQSLALACKYFYHLLVPLLADHMKISDVSCFHLPGRFSRSTREVASRQYFPSTLSVHLDSEVSKETLPLLEVPDLRNVLSLRLERPSWWIEDTFPDYITGLATCIGPQIQTVHLPQSEEWWNIDDLVDLPLALPGLLHLHIADLRCHYDLDDVRLESDAQIHPTDNFMQHHVAGTLFGQNQETDLVEEEHSQVHADLAQDSIFTGSHSIPNNIPHGPSLEDDEPMPILAFQRLEWLALGELSFIPRVLHPREPRGFELMLKDLTPASCPNLVRLDVLQYVGPLEDVLARYDTLLDCLCLSTSAMQHYATSLSSIPSLSTLRVVVDSLLDIPPISHPSLSTISVYVPAALWSYAGRRPPVYIETLVCHIFASIRGPGLPSLQKIQLYSEVPIPVSCLKTHKALLSHVMGVDMVYIDVS